MPERAKDWPVSSGMPMSACIVPATSYRPVYSLYKAIIIQLYFSREAVLHDCAEGLCSLLKEAQLWLYRNQANDGVSSLASLSRASAACHQR